MYGGDEVSAIVIDLGSHTCKAGYAGEDAPKAVFPSAVGSVDEMEVDNPDNPEDNSGSAPDLKSKGKRKLYVGSQALGFRRDHMEVISPIRDGMVVDWDIVENIWDHAFRECLLIDPKEHPMLLAEPCSNTQQQREKAAEIMFEKYQVPALFLAKNAVLTSFASGRATSLVVDSGGGLTTVAPVHDGYVLQKAVCTSPIGGGILTDCLIKSLEQKGITIKPRYSFKRKEIRPGEFQTVDLDFPDTTESYKLYCQRAIASDIKECVSRAPDTPYDDSSYSNIPTTSYELPDGQIIEVGADRFKIPDIIFIFLLVAVLGTILYQLMCLADLEYDYVNPYDSASRINRVVVPEFALQGALCFLHLVTGHWLMFLICLPYLYYNIKVYTDRCHLVDVTEIFNQLPWDKKVRLYKLGYLVILLAFSIFWMVWSIVDDEV